MNVKPPNKYQRSNLENKTVLNVNIIANHFNKFYIQIANEIEEMEKKWQKKHKTAKMMMKILCKMS